MGISQVTLIRYDSACDPSYVDCMFVSDGGPVKNVMLNDIFKEEKPNGLTAFLQIESMEIPTNWRLEFDCTAISFDVAIFRVSSMNLHYVFSLIIKCIRRHVFERLVFFLKI